MNFTFRPRLIDSLKGYDNAHFIQDVTAGMTVAIVALPLAMAFAIASGVKPEAGIFTAIVAGFLISALGGSRVAIGGPTGAFVVILYSIGQQYGMSNLMLCTLLAGILLVIAGFARLGSMIKFIPYPVTVGFTCGIAVLIFSTQLKDFLGLKLAQPLPADFVGKIVMCVEQISTIHPATLVLTILSVLIIVVWPRHWGRWLPGSMISIMVGTVGVWILQSHASSLPFDVNVATIGSRFAGIPQALPGISFPHFDWHALQNLIRPAATIAVLAGVESLL